MLSKTGQEQAAELAANQLREARTLFNDVLGMEPSVELQVEMAKVLAINYNTIQVARATKVSK